MDGFCTVLHSVNGRVIGLQYHGKLRGALLEGLVMIS